MAYLSCWEKAAFNRSSFANSEDRKHLSLSLSWAALFKGTKMLLGHTRLWQYDSIHEIHKTNYNPDPKISQEQLCLQTQYSLKPYIRIVSLMSDDSIVERETHSIIRVNKPVDSKTHLHPLRLYSSYQKYDSSNFIGRYMSHRIIH